MGACLVTGSLMGGTAYGVVYSFTDPGGTDLVDAAAITDGAAFQTNYESRSAALAAFEHGENAIVWTVDQTLSGQALGNYQHYLDDVNSLTYTLDGLYKSQLKAYASDLVIGIADSNGDDFRTRFAENSRGVGSHALVTRTASDVAQTISITFSENVDAFGITWDTARPFEVTIYDAASGGNVIGTLSMAGTTARANTVWSASQEGISGGIGRVELYRPADATAGDARLLQFGVVPLVPEPSGLLWTLGGGLLALRRRRG